MNRLPLALMLAAALPLAASADDYLVGAGTVAANPNRVRIFEKNCNTTPFDVIVYGAGQFGVNVASGDLNGGLWDEALFAPGPGATLGPQIRGWEPLVGPMAKVNFLAYSTPKYGANVDGADVDDDGFEEIVTGAGAGPVFGPHVRGWNVDGGAVVALPGLNFFAYQTLRYGVNPGHGDLENNGGDEILTGPGPNPGFGPQVRGWKYAGGGTAPMARINFNLASGVAGGARATGADTDDDGFDEIVGVAGNQCDVRTFNYDGATIAAQSVISAFAGMAGCRSCGGNVATQGGDAVIVGAGTSPAGVSTVQGYTWNGSGFSPLGCSFTAFPGSSGVTVAADSFGF